MLTLEADFIVGQITGWRRLVVRVEQATAVGRHWTRIARDIAVMPRDTKIILDEGIANDWTIAGARGVTAIDLNTTARVAHGDLGAAIRVQPERSSLLWQLILNPADPVDLLGYTALRFAIHPGDARHPIASKLNIGFNDLPATSLFDAAQVDWNNDSWQEVEISFPVSFNKNLQRLRFSGNLTGEFFIDHIRLVAAAPIPATAVLEESQDAAPKNFALTQNYPNPFNSGTVIRFDLPQSNEIELAIYNLARQKVVTLIQGLRQAGTYAINWDGKDHSGQALALGIYLYELRTGKRIETKKLTLIK